MSQHEGRLTISYGNVVHTFDNCIDLDMDVSMNGPNAIRVTLEATFPAGGNVANHGVPGPTGTPLDGILGGGGGGGIHGMTVPLGPLGPQRGQPGTVYDPATGITRYISG